MTNKITLDASFLIAFLDPKDPHHGRADTVLREQKGYELVMNVVNYAESLVSAARLGDPRFGQAQEVIRDQLGVRLVDLDEGGPGVTGAGLALMRARTNLKMPDVIVLWTAEKEQAAVVSFDEAVRRQAELRGLEVF